MNQLFIVYNPRSSRFKEVKLQILDQISNIKGYAIGKYEVKPTTVEQNVADFSKLLKDGDLVISAGGDATGSIVANSILKSQKDVTLAVLPYGNFNDLSHTLKTQNLADILNSPKIQNFYPLEIIVDGKFFRYATCYVTIGMTAEAVKIYDSTPVRKNLKNPIGRTITSYASLATWYFKNRHQKVFLPNFKLNDIPQSSQNSDYIAINGSFVAHILHGNKDYKNPDFFHSTVEKTTNFRHLSKFMLSGIFGHISGKQTTDDVLEFTTPNHITIQAEGESRIFENAKNIKIKKSHQPLKVIQVD